MPKTNSKHTRKWWDSFLLFWLGANRLPRTCDRLSFGVPSNLLRLLANGIVIGKILAAAAIPFKLAHDDRAANLATEKINRSIKSVAWTITKISLSDKVSSKSVLEKAGLRTLNEMVASQTALMVWKSKKAKDPLSRKLFPDRSIMRHTRSINSTNATQPVPGNLLYLMARTWNSSTELHTMTSIGAAKSVARKWAQNIPVLCNYAKEPWEGLEVARASETGHFIKGKAGRKLNTLATLILGPFHVHWIFSIR